MEFTFGFKEIFMIIGFVFSFAGGYWTLKFQSKNNKERLEDFKAFKEFVYTELRNIDRKCDEMIKEATARDSFVSVELYKSERQQIKETVGEIKEQNTKIMEMLSKLIGGAQ